MAAPEAAPLWQQPVVQDLVRSALGTLTLLVLALAVLRPLLRSVLAPPPPLPLPALPAAQLADTPRAAIADDRLSLGTQPSHQEYEEKLQQARSAVNQDPKRVAQVVRSWVGAEG
jgi:flagellar M-ring protein FliF